MHEQVHLAVPRMCNVLEDHTHTVLTRVQRVVAWRESDSDKAGVSWDAVAAAAAEH